MSTKFWADTVASKAQARHAAPFVVSDWKTPSGRIHVGSLRGVLVNDVVARTLRSRGQPVRNIYGYNDYDPFDKLPNYLDQASYEPFLGRPLTHVPAPDGHGHPKPKIGETDNFARYFADEFTGVYRSLGVESETPRSSELYAHGALNGAIRLVLDHGEEVHAAYAAAIAHRSADRRGRAPVATFPLNVLCQACDRLATTEVTSWNGETVSYICPTDRQLAAYVAGCGHQGTVSPFDGNAKLPWKVEWAAIWFHFHVDVENAGKDHYTKGGSRDVASEVFTRVFLPALDPDHAKVPEDLFYEWFYLGGKKMSTSKGVGAAAADVAQQIPGELLRFLMIRTRPKTAVDFEPTPTTISQLFDEYDRVLAASNSDPASHEAAIMRAAAVKNQELPGYVMRFKKIIQLKQLLRPDDVHIEIAATEEKGSELSPAELGELHRRIQFARIYLTHLPDSKKIIFQENLPNLKLTDTQQEFLKDLAVSLESIPVWTGQLIQEKVHQIKEKIGIAPKPAFQAIYRVFLDRDSGPQVGFFLAAINQKSVVERLREASTMKSKDANA